MKNQTSEKTTEIDIRELIRENRMLREQVAQLSSHYETVIQSLQTKLTHLTNLVAWFRRQIFGRKSERLIDDPLNQPNLPGITFAGEAETVSEEEIPVPAHSRKKHRRDDGNTGLTLPDDIPVEEIIHEIPESDRVCPKTGKLMVEIGRETVDKLARHDGDYYVKRHVYIKYAVPGEALSGVIQAKVSPCVIEGSKFDPSFMADLVSEKFGFHMPLNRFQERLEGHKIGLSRQTLSSLIINLGNAVRPVYDLMIRKIFENKVIFTDDTPVKLIEKGAGKTRQAHMWIYLAGKPNAPPYHVYHFTENWSHEHPIRFLEHFHGTFHADAYEAYEKLAAREDLTWAACWAHARRNFEASLAGGRTKFTMEVLRIMRGLFLFERIAWNRSPEERLAIRRERETPWVNKLFEKLEKKMKAADLLPKCKLAQAIQYMLTRRKNFEVYLSDPDIRMDNNPAERALRKVVLGKKNWIFIGSMRAGESSAVLFSLVQTCRAMGIRPFDYLEDLFTRFLDHPAKLIEEFLPDQWKIIRDRQTAENN